ncbi:MAG: bifunctional 3-deoxy-7-phosphoheptulonate synthase/chorismate mutase type II [Paludibacteraceae bacterium]
MIIAGPCAAESEIQVLETASRLASVARQDKGEPWVFRAGIWKPRTSPDTFQGVGDEGLAWLQRVKEETGLPVATEVATPEHIRLALAAGIDYLWLGARTTANPILVQSLADTLAEELKAGARCTVLVKNPVNEDGNLWAGNVERIQRAGCPVIAVLRGCNHRPCWGMAQLFRIANPTVPMLIDPSHMGGDSEKILPLLQKGKELQFNGAMIEVHPYPKEARSDSKQQITPTRLDKILRTIGMPYAHEEIPCEAGTANGLTWYRAQIDEIDDQLWDLIAKRMEVSRMIGIWKKSYEVPRYQPERYGKMVSDRIAWGEQHQIDADTIKGIYDIIHRESLKRQ